MNVAAWALGVVLAVVFGAAAVAKSVDRDPNRKRLGYSRRQYLLIGLCEIAAAAGVIIGVASTELEWVGLAAAVGLCCLLLGALMAHARVGDEGRKIIPALVMLAVAITYLIVVPLR